MDPWSRGDQGEGVISGSNPSSHGAHWSSQESSVDNVASCRCQSESKSFGRDLERRMAEGNRMGAAWMKVFLTIEPALPDLPSTARPAVQSEASSRHSGSSGQKTTRLGTKQAVASGIFSTKLNCGITKYPWSSNLTVHVSPRRMSCNNSDSLECPRAVSLSSVKNCERKMRLMLDRGTESAPSCIALVSASLRCWRAVSQVASGNSPTPAPALAHALCLAAACLSTWTGSAHTE